MGTPWLLTAFLHEECGAVGVPIMCTASALAGQRGTRVVQDQAFGGKSSLV